MLLSLSMIVKNEERCIARCLESVKDVVDEMVIVDTGSNDNTIALIESFRKGNPDLNIKLLHYEWNDDFADARNFSLNHATSDYILLMDADEYLYYEDISKFNKLLKDISKEKKLLTYEFVQCDIRDNAVFKEYKKMKLIVNHPKLRFNRSIHEHLGDSISKFKNMKNQLSDIRFIHDGYDSNIVNQTVKLQRNLSLLNKMIQKDSTDMLSLYYFGRDMSHFDARKSIEIMKRVENDPITPFEVKEMCRKSIDRFEKAIKEWLVQKNATSHE